MPYSSKRPEDVYLTSFLVEPGANDTFAPYEDTPEEYLEGIRNPKAGRYVVKTTKSGQWLECELYPVWHASRDVPKAAPREPSSYAQKQLNDRNAARNLARKIQENFKIGKDWWSTFTCDNDHLFLTEAEAQHAISLFFDRLRRLYAKHGIELKYAGTVEYKNARDKYHRPIKDEEGHQLIRPHWHGVINGGVDDTEVLGKWTLGGIAEMRKLQHRRTGMDGIAHYITKEPKEGRRRFTTSLNLKTPVPTKSLKNRNATKRNIETIARSEGARPDFFERLYSKEYSFVDCEVRYNKVNDGTYIYCRMERKVPPRRKKGGGP